VLAKIACRDNFTEMHAFKHHQATYEEFYATRPFAALAPPGGGRAGQPRSRTAASRMCSTTRRVMHF